MIHYVFSVLDVKSDLYGPPFYQAAVGQAIRAFTELANDERSSVSKYPGDYKLVQLGAFDDVTGRFEQLRDFQSFGMASDYVKAKLGNVMPIGVKREVADAGSSAN